MTHLRMPLLVQQEQSNPERLDYSRLSRMSPPGASRRRSKKRPRHKFNAADQPRFIHTLVNQKIEDPALIAAVYREWKMTGEWWCHTIHEGRYYKCSIAPFSGARMARLGVDYQPDADSIGLHGNPSLRLDLERFLHRREPLAACACCLGTSGPEESHHLLDRQGVEAWRKEDHSEAIATVRDARLGPVSRSAP